MSIRGSIALLAAATLLFEFGCTSARHEQRPDTATRPASAETVALWVTALPDWPSDGALSAMSWYSLACTAQALQACDPGVVEAGLHRYAELLTTQPWPTGSLGLMKPFLLLRLMFDLPEEAVETDRRVFVGMPNWPPSANGHVDLAWPVGWSDQQPILLANYEGQNGPLYDAAAEYEYFRARFEYRDLRPLTGQ